MRSFSKIYLIFFIIMGFSNKIAAQENPYKEFSYKFISYKDNKIDFFGDKRAFERIFNTFDNILVRGEGQVNILHIGDSHIQADYFTGRIREQLQRSFMSGVSARGFIFPYRMAHSNSPDNYHVSYTGKWEGCKNTKPGKINNLGLAGYEVTTRDPFASININLLSPEFTLYDFNTVTIYHNVDSSAYSVDIANSYASRTTGRLNDSMGYTVFRLNQYSNHLEIKITKRNSVQRKFILHGFNFSSDDAGITYHSVGVNGASVRSYLQCPQFTNELQSILPDMVIISLGTNDGVGKVFDRDGFESRYTTLISMIRLTLPHAAILLTVPGDSYVRKLYDNHNLPEVRNAIYDLAEKQHCGVWDLFTVMGGKNSMELWYENGLSAGDKVHMSRKGYVLEGDLFFYAIMKAYDGHIETKHIEITNARSSELNSNLKITQNY
jgi:lysophospholipase L1-like esterase